MNIEYVGRGYSVDDRIRGVIEEKLEKLDKFLEEPVEVRITLEVEKHRQISEIHVSHKLGSLQAREESEDMYDALNAALAKAEKQARRSRKKLTGRKRRAEPAHQALLHWPVDVVEAASLQSTGDGQPRQPRIIRSSQIRIKPMSIDEAALELEDSQHDFVVFRDANTDKVNVLYKRKDNNYGLIAPEL